MNGQAEGARDLIVAVFRLAVADYMGLSYGHDGPGRSRSIRLPFRSDAAAFLASEWATMLAEKIGMSAPATTAPSSRARSWPSLAVGDAAGRSPPLRTSWTPEHR